MKSEQCSLADRPMKMTFGLVKDLRVLTGLKISGNF